LWAAADENERNTEAGAVGLAWCAQVGYDIHWIRRFLEELARGYNARRA
jgi:hypothetical protein